MEQGLARLDEDRGKRLLAGAGIAIPDGGRAKDADSARVIAEKIGGACVIKALALVTGRAGRGWVRFAQNVDETVAVATELLSDPEVNAVRIEQKLDIEREFFAAMLVDDRAGVPVAVLSSRGGSGIEEIAKEHPDSVVRKLIDIRVGLPPSGGCEMAAQVGIVGEVQVAVGTLLSKLYGAFRNNDCRSLEINPVAWTTGGKLIAADCHAMIDDYAVFRQPQLGIAMARELGHEPSKLELVAYEVEKHDYRGTFYFIQLADATEGNNFVAFHGAGGGGSMMSMDALMKQGLEPANFCDTSGNPPASKVYRAAKILLNQPGIVGYFASGSGVASQEQWQSANGLIKAFRELGLNVPAVIRLGGNQEERAIELLTQFCSKLDAPVESYGKDDTACFCAERLKQMIGEYSAPDLPSAPNPICPDSMPDNAYTFKTLTGTITIDQSKLNAETAQAIVDSCPRKILSIVAATPASPTMGRADGPVRHNSNQSSDTAVQPTGEGGDGAIGGTPPLQVKLNIPPEDAAKGKCIECLACELKSCEVGAMAVRIDLPLPEPPAGVQPFLAAIGQSRAEMPALPDIPGGKQ